jgi:hypothetical protein
MTTLKALIDELLAVSRQFDQIGIKVLLIARISGPLSGMWVLVELL